MNQQVQPHTHSERPPSKSTGADPGTGTDEEQEERRKRLDRALDAALADTFPASDPFTLV